MMGVTEQRAPCRRVTQVPVLVGHPEPAQVIQSLEIWATICSRSPKAATARSRSAYSSCRTLGCLFILRSLNTDGIAS